MDFLRLNTGPTKKGDMQWSIATDENGSMYLQASQDISETLKLNREFNNTGSKGYVDSSKTLAHKAHIPNIVIEMWRNMYGIDVYNPEHRQAVLKLLDDPDWAALRTGVGHLT